MRVVFALVAILIVAVLIWLAIISLPFFRVHEVKVLPSEHLSQNVIAEAAKIPDNISMFTVNADEIEKNLAGNPWVESVEINKNFPSTIEIAIQERSIGAIVVARGGSEAWYMGKDGTWIEPIPFFINPQSVSETSTPLQDALANNEEEGAEGESKEGSEKDGEQDEESSETSKSSNIPGVSLETSAQAEITQQNSISGQAAKRAQDEGLIYIYNIDPGLTPEAGKQVSDSGLASALKYIEHFSSNLSSHMTYMVAPNKSSITMMLDNGVQVALGDPGDTESIKLKETVITNLLAQHSGEVTYINVRVPNQPAWRGLSQNNEESSK
ncbi:MAG: FtsQ-type POTRA domain-containing protein [Coriobacteriia bacterium]|nr:FtsQ-type POTRA domain-containing protein [Coriobacteriia bacterium]